jgi:hypothetical protein
LHQERCTELQQWAKVALSLGLRPDVADGDGDDGPS